jgi:hypothetical protein
MASVLSNPAPLIRFLGVLWENMVFDHLPGWETDYIPVQRPPQGDGTYLLELRADDGAVLVAVSPRVSFRGPCPPGGGSNSADILAGALDFADVLAHMPLHPDGRELLFRRADLELFRAPVAAAPPALSIDESTPVDEDRVELSWSANHVTPLTFQILYITDDNRVFSMARGLTETTFTADLRGLPGSSNGRLGVLATDGLRSAYALSGDFRVTDKPPIVWIQTPGPDDTLPADQPVNLSGQAVDVAGFSLPDEPLVWYVDREVVARGTRLALASGLQPGPHQVRLEYAPEGRTTAVGTVEIRIAERSPEQEEFLRLLAELGGLAPPGEAHSSNAFALGG